MSEVKITKINDVFLKIQCEKGIAYELKDHFSFLVPNYKFHPLYKRRLWDGKINLFKPNDRTIYVGLFPLIKKFCIDRGYNCVYDPSLESKNEITHEQVISFAEKIGVPYTLRDYQTDAVVHCVRNKRSIIVSPTASGKSLIIYLLTQIYQDLKFLVIVPRTSLVEQMATDFAEYGYEEKCNLIYSQNKEEFDENRNITIGTWQTFYRKPPEYFDQFDAVIGDEVHQYKSKALIAVMEKLVDCAYKNGFTGTLDDSITHHMILQGLFGSPVSFVKTKEMIERDDAATLDIKIVEITHPKGTYKKIAPESKLKYQDEIDYLVTHEKRNKFICNLAKSLEGNTLVLFRYVEKQGKIIHEDMKDMVGEDRNVFLIHKEINTKEREEVRALLESEENAIVFASYGIFSTGINIKRLSNIIFASPSKSKINVLQSIGRGLRKAESKTHCTVYDIADKITYGRTENYTYKHAKIRQNIYDQEHFNYSVSKINFEE